MNMKKCWALAASLVLAASLAALASAFAADAPSETRTLTWTSLEKQPAAAGSIRVDGVEYLLSETSDPKAVKTEHPDVPAEATEWKDCRPGDLQATMASFPETTHVDEDGYEGDIPLKGVTYEEVRATEKAEVNATRTVSGLPTNDADQIPAAIEVESEWGNAVTLSLAGLSWTVDAVDERGLPSSYTASALYRGLDERGVIDHYTVTAAYEGQAKAKDPVITYEATATYLGPEPEPEPAAGLDWLPIAVAAAAAAAATACGFFIWYRRRDVRICRQDGETLRIIARATSHRQQDGALKVELPARIDLASGSFALLLRKDKANGGKLHVFQFGKQVLSTKAVKVVRLS